MYHTAIIGAGPAGLATACSLASQGLTDFVIIERGKALADRQRESTPDIASGVGGAGLYSDGKFSFFPSATWLWNHLSTTSLQLAYQWLQTNLEQYGVNPPDFNSRPIFNLNSNASFKAYASFYIDFDNRYDMIDQWGRQFSKQTLTNSTVVDVAKVPDSFCIQTTGKTVFAKNIVIATGRMGSLQIPTFTLSIDQAYQRIEIGVRLKGNHTHPFFQELQQHGQFLDPKFIFTNPEHPLVSWRTFCFCKRGEIMNSGDEDYVALSGRADCSPTNESNIGFNTRIKIPGLSHLLPKLAKPFCLSFNEAIANPELLNQYYDPIIARYVILGLIELRNHFPSLAQDESMEIVGPTIEGVGDYPVVNGQLATAHPGIYVAGDSVGLFRGLTAALLSGHYVGQQIMANHIASQIKYMEATVA